jgi:hypothetical protein
MKKNIHAGYVCAGMALAAALFVTSCPQDEGTPVEGAWAVTNSTKLNLNGERVIMEAWGEPEEDPRQLLGYQLTNTDGVNNTDGTPFWDRYVILYGGRIRNRNCAADSTTDCQKTGLHCHLDNTNMKYIYNDAENKIRPLQERGIKVMISLVPETDGVCIGSLYNWPNEEYWPWEANNNGEPYPFGEEEARKFVQDVADVLQRYRLDGVGYDEEYANKGSDPAHGFGNVYPSSDFYSNQNRVTENSANKAATGTMLSAANRKGGENLFRFAWELQQAMPYPIVQDVYEIRFGTQLPEEMPMYKLAPDQYQQGTAEGDKKVKITSVFDYTFDSFYGSFKAQSANPVPNSKYGPASIALSDLQTAPKPNATPSGIGATMESVLAGDYGMVMYYCFRSREELKKDFPDVFNGNPPEWYLSMISRTLYGCDVEYVGPDYPRMWYWGQQ